MTAKELTRYLEDMLLLDSNKSLSFRRFSPASMIEYDDSRGIAYLIAENWGEDWISGEVVVIWENGERTKLPDEFDIIRLDIWEIGEYP